MNWLNPNGAWAFTTLAAVVILYMLRRRYVELRVPSTYLWRRALTDLTATRPLQRLTRSLLMMLRLLVCALLALALMRPVGMGGGTRGEYMLIFDISASMRAVENGTARIDLAKREASRMISGMGEGVVSVLTSGVETRQLLTRSENMEEAMRAVNAIEAESGSGDLSGAVSLAMALKREVPELNIMVFSDSYIPPEESGAMLLAVGEGADNRAILSLSAGERETNPQALCRVANYGAAAEIQIECYADGRLCDVRTVFAEAGETVSVTFDIPEGAQLLSAALVDGGALTADDRRFVVLRANERAGVALAGRNNVFLEKALTLRSDIDLYKSSVEEAALFEGADLYVFDGDMPSAPPESGALLIINPPTGSFGVEVNARKKPDANMRAAESELAKELTQNMSLEGVSLREYAPLTGGTPILMCGEDVIASAVTIGDRRAVVIGFDVHDSNLPLKYDFPVFVQGLLSYLMPDVLLGVPDAVCGEKIAIPLSAQAVNASVIAPNGSEALIAPPFPPNMYLGAGEVGVYTLSQTLKNGEIRKLPFAVHMPPSEMDVRATASSMGEDGYLAGSAGYGRELTWFVLAALALMMMLEWWVRCREY